MPYAVSLILRYGISFVLKRVSPYVAGRSYHFVLCIHLKWDFPFGGLDHCWIGTPPKSYYTSSNGDIP